jgi:hypothetical protein
MIILSSTQFPYSAPLKRLKEKETANLGVSFSGGVSSADVVARLTTDVNHFALAPLIPNALACRFGFLDRVLGVQHALSALANMTLMIHFWSISSIVNQSFLCHSLAFLFCVRSDSKIKPLAI